MARARFSLPRRGRYAQAILPRLPLADVLAGQFYPRDFRRYDLLIRARVVRAWVEDPADGEAAEASYGAMQRARGAAVNLPRFRALVESVMSEGMNPDYPVGVSPSGPLLDGAHRVAVALHTGEPTLAVDVRDSLIPPDYSRVWLTEAGLAEADLLAADLLLDKFLATTGHDFLAVVAGELSDLDMRVFAPGAEIVATRQVNLGAETVASVEEAVTTLPWPHHDTRAQVPTPILAPGLHTLVRLRLPRPQWHRLPATHTRVSALATGYRDAFARAGLTGVIGLTWTQNRSGFLALDAAGVKMWGVGGGE